MGPAFVQGTAFRTGLSWLGLCLASLGLSALFDRVHLPAALLLGPMIAAIGFGVTGAVLRVPRALFTTAQGVLGCLIAGAVTGSVIVDIGRNWPEMMLAVAGTVAASAAVGWCLVRFGRLPGTSAAWGSTPGAASAMVAMAAEYGADPRLVAFMQYVRVICVVLAASVVSRFLIGPDLPSALPPPAIPEHVHPGLGLAVTLLLAVGGSWLGGRVRLPAGGLLMPLLLGSLLNASGILAIAIPQWLLWGAYTVVGWYVGLQFNRATLRETVFALPQVVVGSFGMILLCAGSAWLLTFFGLTDGLTAFLATSPGGIDSVAIIAIGGHADIAFVLALQTLRLLVVLVVGPPLAKWIARSAVR